MSSGWGACAKQWLSKPGQCPICKQCFWDSIEFWSGTTGLTQGQTQNNLNQNSPINTERRDGHSWWPQAERGPFHFTLQVSVFPSRSIQPTHVTCATSQTKEEKQLPRVHSGLYYWQIFILGKLILHIAFQPLVVSSCLAQLLERSQYEASHFASITPCLSPPRIPLKHQEATQA